jgi:medium-chain acyl-[acyl-carrier-protein] hydrolase
VATKPQRPQGQQEFWLGIFRVCLTRTYYNVPPLQIKAKTRLTNAAAFCCRGKNYCFWTKQETEFKGVYAMKESPTRRSSWLAVPSPKSRPELRLFCFPYAGGGTASFRHWPDFLIDEVELCVLQLPGKESRLLEPPFTRMTDLVEKATEALVPQLDIPFVFFGHSLGARIAFELARALRARGEAGPVELIVSGGRAPQVPDPDPDIHRLPDEELVAEILRRYDGIPTEVLGNKELLELLLPGLRADFELMETYVYRDEPALDCPILCFGGRDDGRVRQDDLDAWREQTKGAFSLRMFEGNHFFLQSEQEAFMGVLNEELGRISGALKTVHP